MSQTTEQTTEPKVAGLTVHRYILNVLGHCSAMMPKGAKPLSLAVSSKGIALYALVDPDAEIELRSFMMIKTGETFPAAMAQDWAFVGTIGLPGCPAVHVFQVPA